MVLRAAEPVSTFLLTMLCLRSEPVSWRVALALSPIVVGAGLTSYAATEITAVSFIIVCIANVMFSIRGILVKKLKQECDAIGTPLDNFNLFFYTWY
jgi:drug/metabolite transporter (DMT)-like permease